MSKKNAIPIRKPAIHIALVESDPHFAGGPRYCIEHFIPEKGADTLMLGGFKGDDFASLIGKDRNSDIAGKSEKQGLVLN